MTREEAIDILKNTIVRFGRTNGKTVYAEALQTAIKALEQPEPCEDAVSRKAAIRMFCELLDTTDDNPVTCIRQVLDRLPSVQPKQKTGKWIVHYECPKCGEITKDFTEYCPFCNADMRGEKDGNQR